MFAGELYNTLTESISNATLPERSVPELTPTYFPWACFSSPAGQGPSPAQLALAKMQARQTLRNFFIAIGVLRVGAFLSGWCVRPPSSGADFSTHLLAVPFAFEQIYALIR